MTKKVYIDFETRSPVDIWTSGGWVYSEHKNTEILCLCYAVDNGPVITLTRVNMADGIIELDKLNAEGAEFHAHNAFFERCMWKNKLELKYLADPIPIKQWRCTAAKCSAHALPRSLENAAEALGCTLKKDKAGKQLMRFLASSTGIIEQSKLNRLYEYCARDVEVEREIDQRLPDLCPSEQQVWFLDQFINDTGICLDLPLVHKAVDCITREEAALTKELQELTGGEINAGTQRDAIKNYLEKKGCKLPNLQKKTIKDAVANTEGGNLRILQLRQQLSLTSNAKYKTMLNTVSADGRVRDILIYHGASTGRWSGKLVQIQNLPKPTEIGFDNTTPLTILKNDTEAFEAIYGGSILPTLSACIRGVFVPTPGYDMFITDFAAIEARVVMWLAGEEAGLKLFRDQDLNPKLIDIYVHMARMIYKNTSLTKKDKTQRQLGKQTVLGSGFGMGEIKFQDTCEKYDVDLGSKTVQRFNREHKEVLISPLAVESIAMYRSTFRRVVSFWYEIERAATQAVANKATVKCGKLTWFMEKDFLRVQLPGGRTLAYHRPKVSAEGKLSFMAVNSVTKKYEPETVWGGTLVENVTQAVARDIMKESMLRMASDGFRILFTVHDELVVEAPKGTKTEADILRTVRTIPVWAPGCPINAECEKVERYKK